MTFNPDLAFTEFIISLRNGLGDLFFGTISLLGNVAFIWILTGLVLVIFSKKYEYGVPQRFTQRTALGIWGALIASQILVEWTIKPLVYRPRPLTIIPEWNHLNIQIFGSSFPSGHTSWAFTAVPILWAWNPKVGKAALAFAVLMGFSRIYVAAHWLSDTIVGAGIGLAIGVGCTWIIQKKSRSNP